MGLTRLRGALAAPAVFAFASTELSTGAWSPSVWWFLAPHLVVFATQFLVTDSVDWFGWRLGGSRAASLAEACTAAGALCLVLGQAADGAATGALLIAGGVLLGAGAASADLMGAVVGFLLAHGVAVGLLFGDVWGAGLGMLPSNGVLVAHLVLMGITSPSARHELVRAFGDSPANRGRHHRPRPLRRPAYSVLVGALTVVLAHLTVLVLPFAAMHDVAAQPGERVLLVWGTAISAGIVGVWSARHDLGSWPLALAVAAFATYMSLASIDGVARDMTGLVVVALLAFAGMEAYVRAVRSLGPVAMWWVTALSAICVTASLAVALGRVLMPVERLLATVAVVALLLACTRVVVSWQRAAPS